MKLPPVEPIEVVIALREEAMDRQDVLPNRVGLWQSRARELVRQQLIFVWSRDLSMLSKSLCDRALDNEIERGVHVFGMRLVVVPLGDVERVWFEAEPWYVLEATARYPR